MSLIQQGPRSALDQLRIVTDEAANALPVGGRRFLMHTGNLEHPGFELETRSIGLLDLQALAAKLDLRPARAGVQVRQNETLHAGTDKSARFDGEVSDSLPSGDTRTARLEGHQP